MAFTNSEIYGEIKQEVECLFWGKIQKDYTDFLDKLSECVPEEILDKLPKLKKPDVNMLTIPKQVLKPMVKNRCQILKKTGQRCPNSVYESRETSGVCKIHQEERTLPNLSHLDSYFKKFNEDYSTINISNQHGRKYYELPQNRKMFDDVYLSVEMIKIDGKPYLLDTSGNIYDIQDEVHKTGCKQDNLIMWW